MKYLRYLSEAVCPVIWIGHEWLRAGNRPVEWRRCLRCGRFEVMP